MRAAQRAEQVLAHAGSRQRAERAVLGDDLVEGACLHELHDDPRAAVFLDHIEDGHHRRVVQPRRGLGLTQRPLVDDLSIFLADHRRDADFLDRDVTLEQLIPAAPDDAHGAAADRGAQAVPSGEQPASLHDIVHGRTLSVHPARFL